MDIASWFLGVGIGLMILGLMIMFWPEKKPKPKKPLHPYEMPPTEMFPMPELSKKTVPELIESIMYQDCDFAGLLREAQERHDNKMREEGRQEVLREVAKMKDSEEFYFTKIKTWLSDRQITQNSTPLAQYGKFMEEALELHQALCELKWLRDHHSIIVEDKEEEPYYRATEDLDDKIRDAIGDVWVTLIAIAETHGTDVRLCVEGAYNEIKDRKGYLNEEGVFVKQEDPDSVGVGYRKMVNGEIIKHGDEWKYPEEFGWKLAHHTLGERLSAGRGIWRRKLD